MAVEAVSPLLFVSRRAAHLCAPVFVALTGLSARLYGARRSRAAASAFLFKRGPFLIVLEMIRVNFAWPLAPRELLSAGDPGDRGLDDRTGGVASSAAPVLVVFGGAPLFFYLLHLLDAAALFAVGPNQGTPFSAPVMDRVWLIALVLAPGLGLACGVFGRAKRASSAAWMRDL